MDIDGQALLNVLTELYPRELQHALSELRARQAEAELARLQNENPDDQEEPAEHADL